MPRLFVVFTLLASLLNSLPLGAAVCGPGRIERPVGEWGFKSSARISLDSEGRVGVDGRKYRFDMSKGWCREDEAGGCAFPLRLNERSKIGTLILEARDRDLFLSEIGAQNRLRVYPVAAARKGAFVLVSLNSALVNEKYQPLPNLPVQEIRSNIIVSERDSDSGDIAAVSDLPTAQMDPKRYRGIPRLSVSCSGSEKLGY